MSRAPLADQARSCLAQVEEALGRRPEQLGEEVDQVERDLAGLRDQLIAGLRADVAADTAARRLALDRVNAVLSLVVGVEYPVAGIQRNLGQQARDALRELVATGALQGLDDAAAGGSMGARTGA
jgi:hypothetical protein